MCIRDSATCDHSTSVGDCESERLRFENGKKYYFSVVYNHRMSAPLHLQLMLNAYTTNLNSKQTPASKPEKQRIQLKEVRKHEQQTVELIGNTLPENVQFTMSGVNKMLNFTTSIYQNTALDKEWSKTLKEMLSPSCEYPNALDPSTGLQDPNHPSIIK